MIENSVKLYNYWGSDADIATIAKLSHGERGNSTAEQLIDKLMKWGHLSVFEFAGATFRVKAPIFVARQWFRHRMASYLEKSLRYTKADEYFEFESERMPPKYNTSKYKEHIEKTWQLYQEMINDGVPKEVARGILPMSTMTEFYVSTNLRSWFNFLEHRIDKAAQYEIRQYAIVIYEKLKITFPLTMEAWFKYRAPAFLKKEEK